MEVAYLEKAQRDLKYWRTTGNTTVQNKISQLIENIKYTPFKGLGKPEPLKYTLGGKWSRRITNADRLIYSVADNTIFIYSLRGHYD